MSKSTTISVKKEWLPNHEDFDWFCRRYPRHVRESPSGGTEFSLTSHMTDESTDYRDCMQYLKRIGCQAMPRRHPKQTDLLAWKGYFDQTNSYAFSTEDFAQSELLAFSLYPGYEDFYVLDQAGMPCVLLERFKDYDYDNSCDYEEESNIFLNGHIHFFRLPDNQLIVSVEGGNLLKQSGLTGFSITRSLRVIGDGADRVKDVYWHVDLPLVLPLSTQTHWERPEGQLYTGFWEPGAELADGEQFLFDRSTVQAAGPFDLAMWKGYQTWPGMIGSHRWFEFCEANKIRCDWRPVRVVD